MYGKGLDGAAVLDPGRLFDQIVWQRKNVTGQDSFGQDVFEWTDFLPCRANVDSTPGRGEFAQLMQRWPEADYLITQHYSRNVSEDMRISWFVDGAIKYLDVLKIDPSPGRRAYQTVVCRTFGGTFTA